MGYDCTLHVVDENVLRNQFVPKLLGKGTDQTIFDRVMENSDELWGTARKSLADDDPETAASAICQLAVMYSACSLPHHYERGFALSLWNNQRAEIAVEYPEQFAFSPEPIFAELLVHHPKLLGHFPTRFTSNYCTGVFIPAENVSEVLAWVEKKVATFDKGDRRQFKGLLGILRLAKDKRFAYWEATDLAVPMAGTFPGDPNLMTASYLGNVAEATAGGVEETPIVGHFASRCTIVNDRWLVSTDVSPFETNFWDMSIWPPQLRSTLPEFSPSVAISRQDQWMLFSETDRTAKPRTFTPRLFTALDAAPRLAPTSQRVTSGGFVAEIPIAFLETGQSTKVGDILPPPLWLNGQTWAAMPGLQAVSARPSSLASCIENLVVGLVKLADGADVVIWDGDGYELDKDGFVQTFSMAARKPESKWTYTQAGNDGFFYLNNRCLFEVHRGKEATAHAQKWTNIMHVRQGPAGGILLQEGNNKDGDIAKLYFPDDDTFIHIEPELFDDNDRYPFVHWSSASNRIIVTSAKKFLAVSTETVLSLPRYRASTGMAVKK